MAFHGLLLRYSGGLVNTDRDSSLGGQASFAYEGGIITPQTMTISSALAGVQLCMSRGNSLGAGTLIWHPDSRELVWIPYGTVTTQSDAGPAPLLPQTLNMPPNAYPAERYTAAVNGDGYYELGSASKALLVYVTEASLPTSRVIRSVTIAANDHNIFDTILYSENVSGDTEYRCIYIHNMFSDVVWLRISITSQPTNATISIGGEGVGNPDWPLYALGAEDGQDVQLFMNVNAVGRTSYEPWSISTKMWELHPFTQSESAIQITNGITGQLSPVLAGESDPTGVLTPVVWGTVVEYSYSVAAGNMVSIWIRRVKAAGVVDPTTDTFQFKIEYYTDLASAPW